MQGQKVDESVPATEEKFTLLQEERKSFMQRKLTKSWTFELEKELEWTSTNGFI